VSKPCVLLTTTAYPPSEGGVQAHVRELRERLNRYQADVATMWLDTRRDWLLGTTVRLAEADSNNSEAGVHRLGWTATTRAKMLPWMLAYYAHPALMGRRISAQMIHGLEQVVTADHRLIHNHRIGREFLSQASLAVARRRGIPFVLTPHHHPKWKGFRYQGWIDVYRSADAVLVLTQAERSELLRLGVQEERLHLIGGATEDPPPADPARFQSRIGSQGRHLVLFVGQLYQYKGVAQLVAAVEALNAKGIPVDLAFLGSHTRFSRGYFSRRSRSWLHVLGSVDQQTKWDAIEAATVVCLPSQHEAFGRVYLEAWSKGKPVVGGRIPAVQEVVTDGETGLLVEPTSAHQIAQALERLVADPDLAARLGDNGRREVQERYTWDRVIGRIETVYDKLLADSGD
jgi:glycosyltransferase involved in cell wall biosynthesis